MEKTKLVALALVTLLSVGLCSGQVQNKEGNGGNTTENNAVEWVDLGLPSGLKWANCNLGATKPEEYGDYYAWGETAPKSVYDWSTYAWGHEANQLTKYCSQSAQGYKGFTDSLTTLLPGDDVATMNLGEGVHIPTEAEWKELIDYTISELTTLNGVYGCNFTGSNGNSIFLPAAGNRNESGLYGAGDSGNGFYWTSSTDVISGYAKGGVFFFTGFVGVGGTNRAGGHTVRAVR